MFVDSEIDLEKVCEQLADAPVLALDTEFIRENTYFLRPCLLQIGSKNSQHAIDVITLGKDELAPLKRLLFNQACVKVFHAARQDLEVMRLLFDEIPSPIFDTQIGESFLTPQTQMGYGALVEKYQNFSLPKGSSLTDWSRRPLDKMQLQYALDDVKYLVPIYEEMKAKLLEKGRYAWVLPEIQNEIVQAAAMEDPENAYTHVKRIATLRPASAKVARALAAWRERTAQKRNVPKKRVMLDEVLVSLSRMKNLTPAKVRRVRGTNHFSGRDVEKIVSLAQEAELDPRPVFLGGSSVQKEPKGAQAVSELINAYIRALSEEEQIAASNIANKEDIADFLRGEKSSRLASGWRYELAGKSIEKILTGEVGLFVVDGSVTLK